MTGIDFAVVENQFSLKSVNLKDIYCSWLIKLHFIDIFCSGLSEVVMLIEFLWTIFTCMLYMYIHVILLAFSFQWEGIKKIYQMLWMESQKEEREKHMNFYPFFSDKRCCYLRFRGKGPSGAVLKPYNFSENYIIHKFFKENNKIK